jgi:hypothetical protein
MAQSYEAGANINWPLVAGLGVAAAVLIYALNIVNGQLQQLDTGISAIGSEAQTLTSPITSISGAISGAINWVGGLFGSSSPDSGGDGGDN